MIVTILFGTFFLALVIGTPIMAALAISSIFSIIGKGDIPLLIIPQRLFGGVDSFPITAVPFFMLAGELMNKGGITRRIVDAADALVGYFHGGLGMVNVVANMVMGGISGSSVADASAVGTILIPEMKKKGYDSEYPAAITLAASTIGILIPPSIPMVIYGVTVGVSIGALLLAGAIPGILVGIFQIGITAWIAKRRGYPRGELPSLKRILRSLLDNSIALIMPLVILGSIISGVVTPTEAAALAVLYSLFVGFFIFRELHIKDLPNVFLTTGLSTGVVLIIVSAASAFSWILASEQIPQMVASFLMSLNLGPTVILLLVNLFLLFVGCFLDITPAIIVLAPILYPVVSRLGVDPVQFGAIMVVNLGIGLCTPPVGNCLYVVSHISGLSITRLFKVSIPYLSANLATLILVTYVPWFSTYLPRLLMR